MHAPMASPRLWTIGYAERDLDDLVATLQKAKVEHVADVRELPLSRKQGMSKGPLATALDEAGIRYSHLKALGAPKPIRDPFLAGGNYGPFRTAYLKHLSKQGPALAELDEEARSNKTAILCLCAEAGRCHRGIVAHELEKRGYKVTHL